MNEQEVLETFKTIAKYYEEYLKDYGVKLVKLKDSKGYYTKEHFTPM